LALWPKSAAAPRERPIPAAFHRKPSRRFFGKSIEGSWSKGGHQVKSDAELFIHWAAEEFVAAGRAEAEEERRQHRRQAEMLTDIALALQIFPPSSSLQASSRRDPIGPALIRAFEPPD
jgi:hypothetical protein